MRASRFLLAPFLLSPLGCGDSCPEISRLDGGWAVYAEGKSATVSGSDAASFPWGDVFADGWSEWDLSWVAGRGDFNLELDGQPFSATYTPDAVDCDAFTLSFDGRYLGEGGSSHDFTWTGDLSRAGSHFEGTFSFEDTWSDPKAGHQGTLSVQGAEVTANTRSE